MPSAVLLLTFVLIVLFGLGIEGVFYAQILAGFVFSCVGILLYISAYYNKF